MVLRVNPLSDEHFSKTLELLSNKETSGTDTHNIRDQIDFLRLELSRYNELIINQKIEKNDIVQIHLRVNSLLSGLQQILKSEYEIFIQFSIAQLLDHYLFLSLKLNLQGYPLSTARESFLPALKTIITILKDDKSKLSILYHCECAFTTIRYMLEDNVKDKKEIADLLLTSKFEGIDFTQQSPEDKNNNESPQNRMAMNLFNFKGTNYFYKSSEWFQASLFLNEIILFNLDKITNTSLENIFRAFTQNANSWTATTDWHLWHSLTILISQLMTQEEIATNSTGCSIESLEEKLLYLAGFEQNEWNSKLDVKKHVQAIIEIKNHNVNPGINDPFIKLKPYLLHSDQLDNPTHHKLRKFTRDLKALHRTQEDAPTEYLISLDAFVNLVLDNCPGKVGMPSLSSLFDRSRRASLAVPFNMSSSIFADYCMKHWAKNEIWPQFNLLLIIPTQHLTNESYPANQPVDVMDIILKECFAQVKDRTFIESVAFQEYLTVQEKNNRILFILDWHHPSIDNLPEHLALAVKKILSANHVLVTTKFTHCESTLLKDHFNLTDTIAVTHFSQKMIEAYIDRYFKDRSGNNTILKHAFNERIRDLTPTIYEYPCVSEVFQHPHYIRMICELIDSDISFNTVTELHYELLLSILRKILRKELAHSNVTDKSLFDYFKNEISFLEYLAFRAYTSVNFNLDVMLTEFNPILDSNKIKMMTDRISQTFLIQSGQGYNLTTEVNPSRSTCCFMNSRMQAFLCASYLLKNPIAQKTFLDTMNSTKEMVIMFMCGQLQNNPHKMHELFDELFTRFKPPLYNRMFMRCWNEVKCHSSLPEDHVILLQPKIEIWIEESLQQIVDHLQNNRKIAAKNCLVLFLQEMLQNNVVFEKSEILVLLKKEIEKVSSSSITEMIQLVNQPGAFSDVLKDIFHRNILFEKTSDAKKEGMEISQTRLTHSVMYPVSDNNNNTAVRMDHTDRPVFQTTMRKSSG